MGQFSKTLIVDSDLVNPQPPYYNNIAGAASNIDILNNGGTIIVEAGSYYINNVNDVITVPSNTSIIGRGNAVVWITDEDHVFTKPAFVNLNYASGNNSRITITGFKIVVDMIDPNTYLGTVIAMKGVKNSLFEKLHITATNTQDSVEKGNSAIYLHDASHCTVQQCTIRDFRHGINLFNSKDTLVKHNHVSCCRANCYVTGAYKTDDVERNTIRGNIFTRATGWNINLDVSKDIIISGNQTIETVGNIAEHGIYPSGCEGLVISGNISCENAFVGIKPRFNFKGVTKPLPDKFHIISGNVCSNNGKRPIPDPYTTHSGPGIMLQGLTEHTLVYGNSCVNNSASQIRVQKNDKVDPKNPNEPELPAVDNMVVGNVAVLHAPPTGSDEPIEIDDATKNIAASNRQGYLS